jgi:hypothetical protein
VGFIAYLIRFALGEVKVIPREGIRLRNGVLLSWREIESVDARGARFSPDGAVVRWLLHAISEVGTRIRAGILGMAMIPVIALLGIVVLVVVLVSGILVPVMIVLSPWHPRVIVRLRDGREYVWRDLGREDNFVRLAMRSR